MCLQAMHQMACTLCGHLCNVCMNQAYTGGTPPVHREHWGDPHERSELSLPSTHVHVPATTTAPTHACCLGDNMELAAASRRLVEFV